jgi:hypothetical protein
LFPNLVVAGTTTQVDTVTMEAANAVVFEGATADDHETTLTIIDPTADRTQRLINQSGYIPLLAALTTTAITSTPEELNILDGATVVVGEINALDLGSTAVGNAIASKAVILDSSKDYTGIRNLTISGEIDAATGDYSGAVDIAGATTTAAITASGIIKTDDTTAATSTTDGSLQTDGGLSVAADAVIGDDLFMLSDAAVITFGADKDVTLTHVADTGLLLNGTSVIQFNDASQNIGAPSATVLDINATDEIELNATLLDVNANINASGTYTGAGTMTTGGNIVIPNAGNIGSVGDTDSIAIASDGVVTMNQIPVFSAGINVSGGSIAGTLSTAAQGNITSLGTLTTLTVDNVVINGATIGHGDDTDLMTVADGILTVAGEVSMTTLDIGGTNVTSTAAELNALDGITAVVGELNALDLGSTAVGNAIASKAVILDSNKDYTGIRNFTIDGDLDVGDDLKLTSDAALISFGANSEITMTHVHDTGLTLTHTATGDNTPMVLQLKSEEDIVEANEVIASIEFAAGDSDGTDGATVAAGIHAIAEGTFSASANATKLVFTTGVSETAASSATAKMTLSSAGLLTIADDLVIKDGGTIGVASDADAITIASNGQVTLTQTLIGTALDISGDVDIDGTLEADAITVNGTALAEFISDTAGAMVSSNTETGIAVTYQDADNTIDFAINAAQTTITSLLATDIKIGEDDQTKIDFETADEIHFYAANAHQVKIVDGAIVPATDDDVDLGTSSAEFKNAFFDGTVTSDAFAGPLTGNVTGNADTATVLATARTIGGVSFNGSANIDLPGVNSAGNQNTTGSAATLTTARTIAGVSFDGSANIDLPGVNSAGNQNTSGSAATLTTARTIGGTSFDGSANIDVALATLATTVTVTDSTANTNFPVVFQR